MTQLAREAAAHGAIEHALAACVHCGFCLPACPTYEATADEADSPRGRIVLMRALARNELPAADATAAYHLDRCLGCRACEPACPSGVSYGHALETTRALLAVTRRQPPIVRGILWLLALPGRQRWLWALARLVRATGLPRWLAQGAGAHAPPLAGAMAMLAATRPANGERRTANGERRTKNGERRTSEGPDRAVLFRGCVMDGLFGHVHEATITALAANDVTVAEAATQVCCGALAAHAGDAALARVLAQRNVAAFERQPDGPVVVNSAGCGAMLRAYGQLLADDPAWAARAAAFAARVRDVSEVLAERGPRRGTRAVPLRVAYDAPCHLLHAQRVASPPLALLAAIPGLDVVPLDGAERCCGAAGLYALLEPALSQEVLAIKLAALARSGAQAVATGNPGCLMHLGAGALVRGQPIAAYHPVELLAWSYR